MTSFTPNSTALFVCPLLIYAMLVLRTESIIGGIRTSSYEFPSIVIVRLNDSHYCGGTIINEQYVVTNAVCVEDENNTLDVVVYIYDKHVPGRKIFLPIAAIYTHEGEEGNNQTDANATNSEGSPPHDIALIKLEEFLLFTPAVSPISVYRKELYPGLRCQTAGYGIKSIKTFQPEDGNFTYEEAFHKENVLHRVDQIIMDPDICENLMELELDKKTQICTIGPMAKMGPNFGDFGGPLICENQQIGVSSYSVFDADTNYLFTIYSNLLAYEDWFREKINLKWNETHKKVSYVNNPDINSDRGIISDNIAISYQVTVRDREEVYNFWNQYNTRGPYATFSGSLNLFVVRILLFYSLLFIYAFQ